MNAWITASNVEMGVSAKAEQYFAETTAFALDRIYGATERKKIGDASVSLAAASERESALTVPSSAQAQEPALPFCPWEFYEGAD